MPNDQLYHINSMNNLPLSNNPDNGKINGLMLTWYNNIQSVFYTTIYCIESSPKSGVMNQIFE